MDLDTLLDQVKDEQSFLEFVRALLADKEDEDQKQKENPANPHSHGWNGWQNDTIAAFLDSAIAWAKDNKSAEWLEANPWKKCALFLYAGKFYE